VKFSLTPQITFGLFALAMFFLIDAVLNAIGIETVYAVLAYMVLFTRPIKVPDWWKST